jgi:uracil DNA glycosylase
LKELFINTELKEGLSVGKVPNDLRYLVKQGVFLGNLAWTTSEGSAGAHLFEEWITFTIRLVDYLSSQYPYIQFLLLGSRAGILKPYIKFPCRVYNEQHPAADRYKATINKLKDSNVLIEINRHLKNPIEWTLK